MTSKTLPTRLNLLELSTPIYEQLQIEESLLRAATGNYCLINYGSPRAIVMGISGNPLEHLHLDLVRRDNIPVIRRFSGGGTVIVDPHTLFISFLFDTPSLPFNPFPEPILRWSTSLYQQAWQIPGFTSLENDYVIHNRKCGGNAQYIRKNRWLHHTSFLWDYDPANMAYLTLPPRRPTYRADRPHTSFLTRLRDHTPDNLIARLKAHLATQFALIEHKGPLPTPDRRSTALISI